MEKGETDLLHYIRENELTDKEKVTIIHQILDTMSQVHQAGIIHRDLSPSNIFKVGSFFKISDFGLGKNLLEQKTHITQSTNNVGTYDYCDPRQLHALKDADVQSDIYSLGRIINFIFTKDPMKSFHPLSAVADKATAKEAKNRYQTVEEMQQHIRQILLMIDKPQREEEMITRVSNSEVSIETTEFIKSMKMDIFQKAVQDSSFRKGLIENLASSFFQEDSRQIYLDVITEYFTNTYLSFPDMDGFGYLGIDILLDKRFSYLNGEDAVALLNIPLYGNRFKIINIVKNRVLGNIDPTLEEKLKLSQ